MSDEKEISPANKLTPKQARFVVEYLVDENAMQAAIRAGYSEKSAGEIGCENLKKPNISSAIRDHLDAQQARTLITADRVLREYGRIGFFDARRLFDADGSLKRIVDMDDDTQAAIAGIDVVTVGNAESGLGEITKIKLADRKGALDSMARHFGLFNDRSTVDVDVGENLKALMAGLFGGQHALDIARARGGDDAGDS